MVQAVGRPRLCERPATAHATADMPRHARCLRLRVQAHSVEIESDHHRAEGHGEPSRRVAKAPDSGQPAATTGQQPRTASQLQRRAQNLVVVVVVSQVSLTAAAGCIDIFLATAVPEHGEAWRHAARASVRAKVLGIFCAEPALRMIVASAIVVLASHKLLVADTACASDERSSAAHKGIEERQRHLSLAQVWRVKKAQLSGFHNNIWRLLTHRNDATTRHAIHTGCRGVNATAPDRPPPHSHAYAGPELVLCLNRCLYQARSGVTPTRPHRARRRWSPAGGRRPRCPGPRTART